MNAAMIREELRVDGDLLRLAEEQMRRRSQEAPETDDGESFNPSFSASRHERAWILGSLGPFYQQELITDVVRSIKGGKEASVYLCTAAPALEKASGHRLVAAKVYRPREFRNLSNDALYREGRETFDAQGKPIRDSRRARALAKKTRFGKQLSIASWIRHEYETLTLLHAAGADIPRPYAQIGNAILMEYVGDGRGAAPALQTVDLNKGEADPLFRRILANVELMLAHNRVHGDLSAYNVLYWRGEVRLIDFPQAVDAQTNAAALDLLVRDVKRICQYFARYGIQADAGEVAVDLWVRSQFPTRQLGYLSTDQPSRLLEDNQAGYSLEKTNNHV